MAQDEYFRLGREGNWLDTSVSRDLASCCGVNLACAGFGVRGFFLEGASQYIAGISALCRGRFVQPPRQQVRLIDHGGSWATMGEC